MKKSLLLMASIVATAILNSAALAETVYIKDDWKVGMHSEPNSSSTGLGLLKLGTALEVLEVGADFSRVKTPNGREGWVGNRYLADQPTLVQALQSSQKNIEKLQGQIEVMASDSGMDQIKQALKTAEAEKLTLGEVVAELQQENEALKLVGDPKAMEAQRLESLITAITLCLVGLFVGFVVGKRLVESKVRARFNGMKVW